MSRIHRYLIVVAGGKGLRMGASVPKQFLLLAGRPVIFLTISRFIDYDPGIELIIVLPEGNTTMWKELCMQYGLSHDHNIIIGGEERYNSVKNGLSLIRQESIVAVHDAVRPLVSIGTIDKCFKSMITGTGPLSVKGLHLYKHPRSSGQIYSLQLTPRHTTRLLPTMLQ